MAQQIEQWSIEKAIACLKRVVHPDVLPSISREELAQSKFVEVFEGEERLVSFLKLIYKKSKGKLEIYGNVNEMIENLREVDRVPEFVVFSSYPRIEVSSCCALLKPCIAYSEAIDKSVYSARSSLAINIYKSVTAVVKSFRRNRLAILIFTAWQITHLNKTLRGLKGTCDFLPLDSQEPFLADLDKFMKTKANIQLPLEPITVESFSNLRRYFDPEDVKVLDDTLILLKNEKIASNQEFLKVIYAEVIFLVENVKQIYEQHAELFFPYAKPENPSIHHKPVIRLFFSPSSKYYLAKEVKNAIELILKNEPSKLCVLEDSIIVESEEERKLGIVYGVQPIDLEKLMKTLNLTFDSLAIVQVPLEHNYQSLSLPIISSYGTHCVPSFNAFDYIIFYLSAILKVFQRSNAENFQKIFRWIEKTMISLFVEKPVFYLIEIWKIEEIIDKARKDLTRFLTEPDYDVPIQQSYTKYDVFREFEKLLSNFRWEKQHFVLSANNVLHFMSFEGISHRSIYTGYSQMVRIYLQSANPNVLSISEHRKMNNFLVSQSKYVFFMLNKDIPHCPKPTTPEKESETFTGFKKGFFNTPIKQESKEQEKTPSCSTENAENRFMEKIRKDKDQLEELLKAEKESLKIATENSEKEIRQLREELEKSKKSKTQLEEDLKSQITTITVGFEEQILKSKEELEKSREMNAHLEVTMKVIEQNHLGEIGRLKEDHEKRETNMLKRELRREEALLKVPTEKSENEIVDLQEELVKSQQAKAQLEEDLKSQIKTVTVGFEERIQKAKEELEKSREMNAHLEVTMKVIEHNHLGEIGRLKEDQKKTESEMKVLKKDLRREKAKNIELEDKKCLKNSDVDIQKLRDDLEKSQQAKALLEIDHSSRIKRIKIGFEEQIQKVQEDLKKSQETSAHLEVTARANEFNHLEEIGKLKEVHKKTEREMKLLKGNLEIEKAKSIELEDKSKTLERENKRLKKSDEDIQKLREDLEKSQKTKAQLEYELTTERNRTENAEKDIQKFQEKLEKTREEKSQLLEYMKREKKRLKNMDDDTRKLREDLETSQKAKAQLEDGLTTQLKAVKINLEEKIQKIQNKLEKSQEAYTDLEGDLKTLILNHLDEIRILNRDAENEKILLKRRLERENAELEHKSKNLEKEFDDSKQKNEFLMSENGKLRADNFKNTEFQQKIKEHNKVLKEGHCGLVDIAWSRLHRLSSEYPDVEEAKIDVRKMEDCVDEFFENVKKDLKKLRE